MRNLHAFVSSPRDRTWHRPKGDTARAGPRHGVAALDGITGVPVDWADSKGLNEWERKALELAEERSQFG